ncbi:MULTISPECIES: flagellar basal body rod protein FlgC [Brucella/Ochrobactrum group]|jgi:flagellar basal-body rod protein FlgC|uniref:Flagellar basal-body rod protein FlgC n=1 Tax=Brucella haematophila TaxID=419474 RepID=A0ABX1DR10_9HYPH|nr:flagellar basal body rod protein FlgC [Brucella haematophila]KAB2694529.1 flagellar basal body rod protein FlgC [Ochrobactrum sp. Kaboul]MBA8822226.1 flagellar basal-body rod protein FlgC [Ochrobactrum sp. P6BSIII]MBA8841732.1 flagellar basal-body rod protein FlgC [Ochrobactrum sp. RH2CCR150]MBJ6133603.1 flagellar basal body rod protein FlgC [Ochrobactrum sp. Q0168]MDH7786851.1 flagellar basal-body rod protein FlgC [Ochrobactrum sp. 19YEA23]OOL14873.1 flagellar basal body rod protein FlgC 
MSSDALQNSLKIAASGLSAQSTRLRIVSENIANAQSTGKTATDDPYRRKTVSFRTELEHGTGAAEVRVAEVGKDTSPFVEQYDPSHPAADERGYVRYPNVNMVVEMADMREANRSYEANLQVVKQARELISMTIDLLRST